MFALEKAILRWTATPKDGLKERLLYYRVRLRHSSTEAIFAAKLGTGGDDA